MTPKKRSLWLIRICLLFAIPLILAVPASAANPVPTVTAPLHPQAVAPGRGDFILTVYGANFVSGAVVNWNGSPRSTTFVSARELRAKILASDVVKPTAGYITVTNPAPGGGNSSSSSAIVEVHQPTTTIVPGPPHTYQLYDVIESLTPAPFHKEDTFDLLAAGGSGKVYLFTGNGDGTFTNKVVGDGYYSVYNCNLPVGDFNNDGKLDYIFPVGQYPNSAVVKVRLGNGKGSFRTSGKYGTFQSCPDIVVGDFNEDGKLDFATADPADGVQIFLGNGDGTFQQAASYGILGASNPVVADFNGDGKLDLVIESYSGILLLLGNGDGTFQSPQTIFPTAEACGSGIPLVVNDFNGDGKLDLAFCSTSGNGQIGVVLGNGDGTFKKPVYYHAGANDSEWAFAAGDFNSDGKTDFIVWYFKSWPRGLTFAILLGNGDGTFQKETTVSLPDNIEDLAIVPGDFNSDGLLDFVMLNAGIQVYTQK
jgi:hypothetical protein